MLSIISAMMAKNQTMKLLERFVDKRTSWGKKAIATVEHYYKTNQTTKISLLKGLMRQFDGRPLNEILNVDPVDYQRKVKGTCVCSRALSNELYRMKIRSPAKKHGIESHIFGKIKDKVPVSHITRKSNVEFILGSECYVHLPDLLSDFGYHDLRKTVRKSKKQKQKELEKVVNETPDELKEKLKAQGIDTEQYKAISELMEGEFFTDEAALYNLDSQKNRSFANWFRKRAKDKGIKHNEIADIVCKLEKASHLVTPEELAKLAVYSFEYRRYETKAVCGGLKSDLLYLADLSDGHELVQKHGRINIDKMFVRPATKYRSRKGLEKVTIRQKLGQSHMTFIDGLGIKMHFPNILGIREQANREFAQKYGVGRAWDYLLSEIRPVLEGLRKEYYSQYCKFGVIVHESVLTRAEYLACRNFFRRSQMGRGSDRSNYLRMHTIEEFRNAAPVIAAVGRKVRYAKEKTEAGEKLDEKLMKRDYFLAEDLEQMFRKMSGIDEDLGKVIDMIVNAQLVGSKAFNKFQQEHGHLLKAMYDNGLVAKEYMKGSLKKMYNMLRKEKVRELDQMSIRMLSAIIDAGNVHYEGPSLKQLRNAKYISQRGFEFVGRMAYEFERIRKRAEDCGMPDLRKLRQPVTIYSSDADFFCSRRDIGIERFRVYPYDTYKPRKSAIKYALYGWNAKAAAEAVDKINAAVEVDNEWQHKLDELCSGDNLRLLEVKKHVPYPYGRKQGKAYATPEFKKEVESLYEKLQQFRASVYYAPLIKKREQWSRLSQHEKDAKAAELLDRILHDVVGGNAEYWEIINGIAGGYLKQGWHAKVLERSKRYVPAKAGKADLTFRRFMEDGTRISDGRELASGAALFSVNDVLKSYLKDDVASGVINKQKYNEYLLRIGRFEKAVNDYLSEKSA
jgi:hypothetical protein